VDQSSNNAALLKQLFELLLLCTKIFVSLNCQDLPEFVEDNLDKFMALFQKYLAYRNPLLAADDDEEGPEERLKTEICTVIDLFATKYEEDFPKLPVFVEAVWHLLSSTGLQVKNDMVH
jgi:exportin-2 (importin alpha re-exporter)